jgi:hypothetical protein
MNTWVTYFNIDRMIDVSARPSVGFGTFLLCETKTKKLLELTGRSALFSE